MNIDYIKFYVQKIEIMNLLLLIMNMHMHRMMSHSILLNCLVIVIELLGAEILRSLHKVCTYCKNYDVQKILTICWQYAR
jgi:hypothetical protein